MLQGRTWNKPCKYPARVAGRASWRLRRDGPLISPARNPAGPLHSLPPLQGGARRPRTGSRRPPRPAAAPAHAAGEAKFTGREVWSETRASQSRRGGGEWAVRCAPPVPGAECAPPPARRSSRRSARVARPRVFCVRRARGEPGSRSRVLGEGRSPGRKNGVGVSLPGEGPVAAGTQPGRPALCARPSSPPWAETWPLATALWTWPASPRECRSGRALQVCAVGHRCAARTGEAGRPHLSRQSPWSWVGTGGSQAGRQGPRAPGVEAFRGKCRREAAGA